MKATTVWKLLALAGGTAALLYFALAPPLPEPVEITVDMPHGMAPPTETQIETMSMALEWVSWAVLGAVLAGAAALAWWIIRQDRKTG